MAKAQRSTSNIKTIDYNEETQTLTVIFSRGDVYDYPNVPKEVYEGFTKTASQSAYFKVAIKDKYRFNKK